MRSIIGITCLTLTTDRAMFNALQSAYVRSVEKALGVPIILSLSADQNSIDRMLDVIDGLILSGGTDVDPHLYGEEPHPKLGLIDVAQDRLELPLIKGALERDIPILAICRGIQVLNVAAGGTLYQDILSQIKGAIKHQQRTTEPLVTHSITIEKDTHLSRILGTQEIMVNSYHHQSVKDAAPGFIISARSIDGVIEAIESTTHRFVVGVQCHPERLWEKYPVFIRLFEALVNAAAGNSSSVSV